MNEPHYDSDHTQVRTTNTAAEATQRNRRVVRRRENDTTISDPSATRVASTAYGYNDQYHQPTGNPSGQRAYGSHGQGSNAYRNGDYYQGNAYGQSVTPVAAPPQEQPKKKESPVSMPVAIGSALSAVTSLFLSSHIGIGGSVVTVAVGAIASSLMSQAYTHIVSKSAEKVKDLSSNAGSQQIDGVMDSSQLGSYSLSEDGTDVAATGTPIASDQLHDAAAKRHGNAAKRKGIIITIVVALAMVLVTAGIITFATQGSGIGTKTAPIIATTSSTPNDETTRANESQVPEKDGEDTSSTDSADSSSKNTTTDSNKSNSGNSTSGNANSGSSNSSSSSNSSESNKGNSTSSNSGTTNSSNSSTSGNQSSSNGSSNANGGNASNGSSNSSNSNTSSGTGNSTNSGSSSSSSGKKENSSGASSSASGTSSDKSNTTEPQSSSAEK